MSIDSKTRTRSDPVGGSGGTPFTDELKTRVTAVRIRCGSLVDAIQLFAGEQKTALRGGDGGIEWKFSVPQGDTIVAVRCRGESKVDGLQFQTAKGTWSPLFGTTDGAEKTFFAPKGCGLVGIFGQSSKNIDRIGFIWEADDNADKDHKQTLSSNYFGGIGGNEFDDSAAGVWVGRRPIRSVTVRSGVKLDSIQMRYEGELGQPPAHGGLGGLEKTFTVPPGEFITTISLRSGNLIDGIQFFTDKGTGSGWYGGSGGNQYELKAPSLSDDKTTFGLSYIQGRSGLTVDALRFVWAPVAKSVAFIDFKTADIDTKADIIVLATTTLTNNDTKSAQTCQSSIAVSYTNTSSFVSENANSYAFSIDVTGSVGVPDVASASTTLGFTYTRSDSTTNTYESSQTVEMSVAASQVVPAASTVEATVTSKVYRAVNLPYTAKMVTTWLDGSTSQSDVSGTMSGIFHAKNTVSYSDPTRTTSGQ